MKYSLKQLVNKIINSLCIVLPDKLYLKMKYKIKIGKKLDLKNPKTYNEKLQWLKLYDRKDIYTKMVDKYEVKNYISETIGEKYIIPTIGIYDSFEQIDFDKLPNQFVMKCTHNSGGIVICKDKKNFDREKAKIIIKKCLKKKFYYDSREWPYKNVKPRIIIEKYMEDSKEKDLKDYKFFCFNGEPKLLFVAVDRPYDTKFNFYDMNFQKLPFMQHYKNFDKQIHKPQKFDEMTELCKKLSKGIPHVRVDFYEVDGKVYFGELTFFHFAGFEKFEPAEWDYKLGEFIDLDLVKKL